MSTLASIMIFVPVWILVFMISGLVIYGIYKDYGKKFAIVVAIIIMCVASIIGGLIIDSQEQEKRISSNHVVEAVNMNEVVDNEPVD